MVMQELPLQDALFQVGLLGVGDDPSTVHPIVNFANIQTVPSLSF